MKGETEEIKTNETLNIDIPGIDSLAGIRQCGSVGSYLDLLGDIYRIIDKKCAETERFLAEGDLRAFTTHVHSLKTTCRMLGHSKLSDSFFELETLGKEGGSVKASELAPAVLDRFRSLKPLLEPYLVKETTDRIPFSAADISALLSELLASLDDFDINNAEIIIKKLLAYECGGELANGLEKLSGLVNDLEYDEASELARELKGLV